MRRPSFILVLVCLAAVTSAASGRDTKTEAQPPTKQGRLDLAAIFASGQFDGESFSGRWADDKAEYITFEPSRGPSGGWDLVGHDPASPKTEILVPAEQLVPPGESSPLRVHDFAFSKNRARLLVFTNPKRVWRQANRGDYWVLDRTSRELRRLGGDAAPSSLRFAKFSPEGRRVAYVRQNDLYVEDLTDGRIRRLTRTGSDTVINGTFDWVYEEEFLIRDGFRWSPDGRSIAYWQLDTSGVDRFPLVNQTDGLYPRIERFAYPKTGRRNSACRIGVVEPGGKTRWMAIPGDPREHYLPRMCWVPHSRKLLIQQLDRRQQVNRVFLADADTGAVETILVERDEAWVDVDDELFWLDGGKRFTWLSQRDGWRHVYLVSLADKSLTLLTPGEYDVIRLLAVDEPGGRIDFIASPDDPTRRYLYCAPLDAAADGPHPRPLSQRDRREDGGLPRRLSPTGQPGTHDYQIAPGSQFAFHAFSTIDTPPRIELVTLPGHKTGRTLLENRELRRRLAELAGGPTEFFRVDVGEGVELDAWCIAPPEFDPSKRYPLLVYVYGEPCGQTVLDRWGGKGHLWHRMLAQRGYLVMSFDNRGTPAPRGRAWRTAIYRRVGILAPAEQAAALRRVLATQPYVDPDRVGIWGWSGGGSMTLNAILKYPDLYHTAMAVAPVAGQRYYDTIYQERYMGLPDENVQGYIDGSPLTYAKQLRGNLLLVHGTGDDNCHYQATEALINALVLHNRPFTMMAYPNRSHGIHEGTNTTLHLRELLTRYLEENLPPGPKSP